jgi:cytochrome b6-f complex iron-sulfur subunit
MLVVFKQDLQEVDFLRVEQKIAALPYDLRWARRGGRLVLLLENASGDEDELKPLVDDAAVEYVLKAPSAREITRLFSRRDLLNLSLASTGVLTAAALLAPLGFYLAAPPGERSPRGDVFVGMAEAIPVGGARARIVDGEELLIIRRGPSRFHALSAVCTHSEVCSVAWNPSRHQLVCPCHRGVFDLDGNVVSGPPPRPLPRREVTVRNGRLHVSRAKP